MNSIEKNPHIQLFQGQEKAAESLHSHFFPRYTSNSTPAVFCNGIHDILSIADYAMSNVIWAIQKVAFGILFVVDFTLGWAIHPVLNVVYPVNPINGHRHFVAISRSVEKFLGDYLFYPLNTLTLSETEEELPKSHRKIATVINKITSAIVESNQDLLNPPGETPFDYRMKTVKSTQLNAFAAPAGGMVIYSQLAKELELSIENKSIKSAQVSFEDGSKATVDLRNITLDDVLASLIGHETTHAGSRHSMALIFESFARKAVLFGARIFSASRTEKEEDKEKTKKTQENQTYLLDIVEDWADYFIRQFTSRKNEYEADITGSYLAKKASFNPLGALYLQQFFLSKQDSGGKKIAELTEFLSTHPQGEKRLRALFVAIAQFSPESLDGKVQWDISNKHNYDLENGSPAIYASRETKALLEKTSSI